MKDVVKVLCVVLFLSLALLPVFSEGSKEKSGATVESVDDLPQITLSLGNIDAVTNPANIACEKFVELVAEKSNGRIQINLFPASQLGSAPEQLENVRMGSQDMLEATLVFWGEYQKDWNILSLAFLWQSREHLSAFLNSELEKEIEKKFAEEQNVVLISKNWFRPFNMISTKKRVDELADLKGLKMRVPEIEMYKKNWEAMGCKATPVSWGEVYLALQQDVVEGVDLPIDFLKGMKFYEVAPYVTMTRHLFTNAAVHINKNKWESLPKLAQEILIEAANEAGDFYTNLSEGSYKQDIRQIEAEEDVEFIELSENEMVKFRAEAKNLAEELASKGYWSEGLYEEIQKLAQ